MAKIMASPIIGQAALQFLNVYAVAWTRGMHLAINEYDPLSLNDFLYEMEYVRAEATDAGLVSRFQSLNRDVASWTKEHSGTSHVHSHFCLGYLSVNDEGTRCVHGLAIVGSEIAASWESVTSDGFCASLGLTIRKHRPEPDRLAVWKQLAYGVALSASLTRMGRPCFTAHGPMVEESALHFKGPNCLFAELRSPDVHPVFAG